MSRGAISIGSIAGVPLRFHWSWAAVMLLVAAALSQLYATVVGAPGGLVVAVSAVLLLCASVLLHELGHALVARRYGLAVSGITLFALGGVTEILDGQPDPVRDMAVALAGPCVSLLLSIASGLAWWFARDAGVALLALHLALTNAAMALFNMLPGFPLDGGRVLWAVMSFLMDDEVAAARLASRAGQVCGWALLAGGALYGVMALDVLNGAWIVLVGFFLVRNAPIGYRRFVVQHLLDGIFVADVMQRVYRTVAPELRLDQFVGRYVLGQVEQGFPVLSSQEAEAPRLLGMITVRNLRRFRFNEWSFTRVGEAMTPLHHIRPVSPEMPAGEALRALLESGEDQLPVLEGATLIGLLRRRDLLGYIDRRARVRKQ